VADAHVRNITDQQLLNVDNHHDILADDPQELVHNSGAAREQLGVHESELEQQFAAREEEGVGEEINAEQCARDPVGDVILDIGVNEKVGGVQELVSSDRVGNILAENANNNAQLLAVADTTAADGENIDYQAYNNDTHEVFDAPVGDVPRDNINDHHMANVDPQEPGVQVPPDIPVDG